MIVGRGNVGRCDPAARRMPGARARCTARQLSNGHTFEKRTPATVTKHNTTEKKNNIFFFFFVKTFSAYTQLFLVVVWFVRVVGLEWRMNGDLIKFWWNSNPFRWLCCRWKKQIGSFLYILIFGNVSFGIDNVQFLFTVIIYVRKDCQFFKLNRFDVFRKWPPNSILYKKFIKRKIKRKMKFNW